MRRTDRLVPFLSHIFLQSKYFITSSVLCMLDVHRWRLWLEVHNSAGCFNNFKNKIYLYLSPPALRGPATPASQTGSRSDDRHLGSTSRGCSSGLWWRATNIRRRDIFKLKQKKTSSHLLVNLQHLHPLPWPGQVQYDHPDSSCLVPLRAVK